MAPATLRALFWEKTAHADLALIEGNRGLFDGKDVTGSCSTAELARQIEAPVVLTIDCTKMTRTVAAIVAGCAAFEPGLTLAGVILNRTAGPRHRAILREAIEHYTDIPVLGVLPKIPDNPIPERHMGLISNQEYDGQEAILEGLADIADECLDLDALWRVASAAPPARAEDLAAADSLWPAPVCLPGDGVRIGYVRDAALWFYYEENLEALRAAGAELVELSLLSDAPWPEIHGLYLGGGFPETQAAALAANTVVRERVRALSASGLPIYAECGGFMYLGESLSMDGADYPMAGVFPVRTSLCPRPQGLGYIEARVMRDNPFHPQGVVIQGHEFHYSLCADMAPTGGMAMDGDLPFALALTRGSGMRRGRDGLITRNTFAGYTHVHALGVPHWAPNFVRAALARKHG